MDKKEQVIGYECYDTIYLRFDYIGDDEFEELIEYIEDNHISYEGATDIFIDLQNQVKKQKKVIDKVKHILNNQFDYYEYVDIINDIEDALKEVSDNE